MLDYYGQNQNNEPYGSVNSYRRYRDASPKIVHKHTDSALKNISKEAWNELAVIVENESLTKAELELQLRGWAAKQGRDILKYCEMKIEKKLQEKRQLSGAIEEMLKQLTLLYEQLEEIKVDDK
ncbi:unnamed protein product [Enterobius vermicularis]|uniref:DUF148 domain-containing protein n=1 Tax=Enterobius vermicularis TaxID=51028 RepID=A0A0N4VAU5_ENTVE|nr:unnamed protein product [Enterobius vermicularis]